MASWLTRALDRITPWDRGGEVQRRQERKRREEEQYNAPRPQRRQTTFAPQSQSQSQSQFQNTPSVEEPTSLFGKLIPQNKSEYDPMGGLHTKLNNQTTIPKPRIADGQGVLRPEVYEQKNREELRKQAAQVNARLKKPKQSFWNKVRDQFDANTEADQYRRAKSLAQTDAVIRRMQGATREDAADRATARANIIAKAPHRTLADDVREFNVGMLTGAKDFAVESAKGFGRGVKMVTANPVESLRSEIAKATGNKNAEAAAERRQILNMFGQAGLDKIERGERLGWGDLANALLEGASVLPAIGGARVASGAIRTGATQGGRQGLTTATKGIIRGVDDAILGVGDANDVFKRPNNVVTPVRPPGIPVNQVQTPPQNVNVRNLANERPLIREIGGDAASPTLPRTPEEIAAEAFQNQPRVRPDGRIEGISPQSQEMFNLTDDMVIKSQDDIIDQYAAFLRDVGEGNGVQILPDQGKRVSHNVRFGDTKGKRMTKAMWRDEAERQLRSGDADPYIQKLMDDAADPEIQSLLARGERPEAPVGKPIEVQQSRSIPVRDETNIPQGLPETPGTVRATTATDKQAAKTALAAEQPVVAPVRVDEAGNVIESTPTESAASATGEAGDSLDNAYERLVKNLEENRKSYKVEKKIKKAEAARRTAEKQRIYDELVNSGMSRFEAERQANKALAGKYTRNTVDNFDVTGEEAETFRKAIDDYQQSTGDGFGNTKQAFEHMIDPNRTDPLRDWERTAIRRFVQHKLGDDAATALDEALAMTNITGDTLLENRISSFMTGAIAAGDISAVGRQGLFGWVNHPKMSSKALTDSLGALVDPKKEQAFISDLVRDSDTAFFQQNMKSKYQTLTDVADEARGKDTTNRLTSWYVNPSNRQYNVYLDSLRHQQRKSILEKFGGQEGFLAAAKAKNPKNPDKWMEAWEKVVGNMSGRGMATKGADLSVQDAQVLFSVRNLASRFAKLTSPLHLRLLRDNPQAYLYQLRETAAGLGAIGTTLAVAGASGLVEVENGRIKVGPTRIDVSGGLATIVNSAEKVAKYVTGQSDGPFDRSGGDIITDFMRNQLSPALGTIGKLMDVKWSEGKDRYGNEIDPMWFAENVMPFPAVLQGTISGVSEGLNPLETVRNAALEGLGFNTNVYQSADDKKQQKEADLRAQYGGDPAIDSSKSIEDQIKESYGTGFTGMANRVRDIFDANTPADQLKRAAEDAKTGANTGFAKYIPEGTTELTQKVLSGVIDDAYYENDWDALVEARQASLDRINNDGNSTKSKRDAAELELKRANFYKDNDYTSSDIDEYYDVGVTEWRKMGYPPGHRYHDPDVYNPELQEKLWQIDEAMAQAGVSFVKNKPDKQKYSPTKSSSGGGGGRGGGRGGRGGGAVSIGKLTGSGSNAPQVREYQTMAQTARTMPRIRRTNPNIVHTIRSGRV